MTFNYLKIAGALSLLASAIHLAIIVGGASWYRFFGAGEHMANMAEQGVLQPTLITLFISFVLATFAAYAWSAAEVFPDFPLSKTVLILITLLYLELDYLLSIWPGSLEGCVRQMVYVKTQYRA